MSQKTWEECVAFHGHQCPGLSIGYRASQYAIELLELTFSEDEQVVCVAENDACGIDGIQVMLGCSVGKGQPVIPLNRKTSVFCLQSGNGEIRAACVEATAGAAYQRENNGMV